MTNDEIPNDEGIPKSEIGMTEEMTNDEIPNDEGISKSEWWALAFTSAVDGGENQMQFVGLLPKECRFVSHVRLSGGVWWSPFFGPREAGRSL